VQSAAAAAPISPAQLLASSLGAASEQRSVHYVSTAIGGESRLSMVGDAGATRGIQRITYSRGSRTGHVTVVVLGRSVYFRGDNSFVLHVYMSLKPSSAARYVGRWIEIPRGDGEYAAVAEGVTLLSTIEEASLAGPLSRLPDTTIDGQLVHAVKGRLALGHSQTGVLYLRATGPPLPVQQTFAGRGRGVVTFSNWNEPVSLPRPTAPVPVSKTR
jgi:hypothetical protein